MSKAFSGMEVSAARIPGLDPIQLVDTVSMSPLLAPVMSSLVATARQSLVAPWDEELGMAASYVAGFSEDALSSVSETFTSIQKSSANLLVSDFLIGLDVTESMISDIATQTNIAAMAASQLDYGDAIVSRALLSSGIDAPFIHTPHYREPKPIRIDDSGSGTLAEEQEKRQRRIRCQDALFELETNMRDFIETELSSLEGPRWWKRRVHQDIRRECESRQVDRERGGGIGYKPIEFAYIGHLQSVILQRNNWDEAFEGHFESQVAFQAMMQWVTVVRNDVDHARYSSNSDYIQFMTAANWLHRRMGLDEPFDLRD
jgi:hypothetical protein